MKSISESIIGKKGYSQDPFKVIKKTWGEDKYLRLMEVIEEAKKFGGGKDVMDDRKWEELFGYILRNHIVLLSKDFSDAIISYFEEAPFEGDFGGSEIFAKDFKNSNWEALVDDIILYIENYE